MLLTRLPILLAAWAVAVAPHSAWAVPSAGTSAPAFELDCTSGRRASSGLGDSGLGVVTFLALDSKASRELAISLSDLATDHSKDGLTVVGVLPNPVPDLTEFSGKLGLGYPLCSDPSGQTIEAYGARQTVPATFVVGPGGIIARSIVGGGSGAQQVILAIAEKEFARGNVKTASKLFGGIIERDPKSVPARAGAGYALAREGKLERAEEEFKQLGQLGNADAASAGLADVALRRGDLDAAAAKAKGDDPYSHVVKGQVAAKRGDTTTAEHEFKLAASKPSTFPWQQAEAYNNLARIASSEGNDASAINHYDSAVKSEPLAVEPRRNKAVALERTGRAAEAKATLRTAKAVAPQDQMVAALLERIDRQENDKVDVERQKLTSQLISDLVTAYEKGGASKASGDARSGKLVIALVEVQDKLGPTAPDGLSEALVLKLTDSLQQTGRVRVVEREILDKLLTELKLGSSDLADPTTRLKLGRVLGAGVIATGGLYPLSPHGQLQLRLIDTETTEIVGTMSEDMPAAADISTFADSVAGRITGALERSGSLRSQLGPATVFAAAGGSRQLASRENTW